MKRFRECILALCIMCSLTACGDPGTGILTDGDERTANGTENSQGTASGLHDTQDIGESDSGGASTDSRNGMESGGALSSEAVSYSYDDLLAALQNGADGDTMVSEPLVADFNGDGQDEMVGAFGHPSGEMFLQYFVHTDGVRTETFGDEENSVHYETNLFPINVGNETHIAYSSHWRAAALGGWMSSCGIFAVRESDIQTLMYEEFCELDNPEGASIEMISYKEAQPGTDEVGRDRIYWKNGRYTNADISPGIDSSGYRNASIQPKEDPESVWAGTEVMEIRSADGVHFYLPADCNLYVRCEDYDGNLSSFYYDSVKLSDTRFILSEEKQDTWTLENSDFGAVDPWEIGAIGDEHYFLVFPTEMEADLIEMMEFCNTYRERIVNSAWVE